MADSQRLLQRNKNVLTDVIYKQQLEQKKTIEFLKYALSYRPNTDFMKNSNTSYILPDNQSPKSIVNQS
jgi:hypothetical protein